MNSGSTDRKVSAIHDLPSSVQTLRGSIFDARVERWTFHDGVETVSLNFALFPSEISRSLVESVKRVLIWYAENLSPGQLKAHFHNLQRLFRFMTADKKDEIVEISASDLMNYRASLGGTDESFLGAVAACLKKWHDLKIPGVSADAVRFLNQVRLKGSEKGKAVLTMDPIDGPFTDIEIQAIRDALNDAYANSTISLQEFVLAYLFILLGQRSRQIALLKVCDVVHVEKRDGTLEHVLRVPRVKQGEKDLRAEFKERILTPAFGELLMQYAKSVSQRFTGAFDDPSHAPLFPAQRFASGQPTDFLYHRSSLSIARMLKRIIDGLSAWSERTGARLHITTTRFRRTIGTRAAKEGHGELIIAELLDHSDTQNVGVYVRATPEIIERIDKAISLQLAPLAQAFKGRIISGEKDAMRGDDPTSRIVDPGFSSEFTPMGNCARHGPCEFLAPIACYTCKSFQAWADGPHEEVLSYLISERERRLKNTDERIASVNDRTILAVAQVVRLCRESLHNGSAES